MVVEDRRGRQRGQDPADHRLGPRVAIADAVFLEVFEDLDRSAGVDLTIGDLFFDVVGNVVGVELISQHQQRIGPQCGGLVEHPGTECAQRIDSFPFGVPEAAPGVGRPLGRRGPAGPECQTHRPAGRDELDLRLRERVVGRWPRPLAIEAHVVRVLPVRFEAVNADEREMVAFDLESLGSATENLHLAGAVGLHPDGGVGLADMPQHRADADFSHVLAASRRPGRQNSRGRR